MSSLLVSAFLFIQLPIWHFLNLVPLSMTLQIAGGSIRNSTTTSPTSSISTTLYSTPATSLNVTSNTLPVTSPGWCNDMTDRWYYVISIFKTSRVVIAKISFGISCMVISNPVQHSRLLEITPSITFISMPTMVHITLPTVSVLSITIVHHALCIVRSSPAPTIVSYNSCL